MLIAHPLLAALPGELNSSWERAVGAGQPHVHAAERHAPHCPVQASALVLAAALEGLPAPVHHPSEHTWSAIPSGAHADLAVGRGAEVAEEPLVVVAGVPLGAQLAQLLGAHPAAAAAVLHQAHPGRARGGWPALALAAAVLAGHLPAEESEEQRRGEAAGSQGCRHARR